MESKSWMAKIYALGGLVLSGILMFALIALMWDSLGIQVHFKP